MSIYFNPSNESFTSDKISKIYIDKTGLLEYLNGILGTNSRCIALSHARHFGKSHAAEKVAEIIELAHETYTSVLNYNDEACCSRQKNIGMPERILVSDERGTFDNHTKVCL